MMLFPLLLASLASTHCQTITGSRTTFLTFISS
jgi:hypothetical protein